MNLERALEALSQVGIVVFGAGAVLLLGSKTPATRRWGYLCGLLSEPFWLYTASHAAQTGVIVMVFVYTAGWVRGLRNNWRVRG